MDPDPGLRHLTDLGRVAATARRLMADALARGAGLPASDHLESTREHLGQVREGFLITVRTTSFRSRAELRDVVHHILVDWKWLEPFGIRPPSRHGPIERPLLQVLAFAHASVALGAMRHLPTEQVTFPRTRKTYADIPVPGSPGEILERIEEMEAVIARGSLRPLAHSGHEAVRRTYGYFETGAWLLGRYGPAA
jgi:hypothetical protein